MKRLKYFIVFAVLIFVLVPSLHYISAASTTELTYPNLPGATAITRSTTISQYIQYIFRCFINLIKI